MNISTWIVEVLHSKQQCLNIALASEKISMLIVCVHTEPCFINVQKFHSGWDLFLYQCSNKRILRLRKMADWLHFLWQCSISWDFGKRIKETAQYKVRTKTRSFHVSVWFFNIYYMLLSIQLSYLFKWKTIMLNITLSLVLCLRNILLDRKIIAQPDRTKILTVSRSNVYYLRQHKSA